MNLARAMTKSSGDFYTGLRYGLASLLQSPDFLFRKEVAVPAAARTTPWTPIAAPPASAI